MSKILVSGGLVPTTKDTLLDARTRVATFADIANIENPARFMVITVEDTGKKYEVRKLSSKIIGGIVVENSTIDITDPEALVDLGLAEELRSEDEKIRQSNESKRIEAENLRKTAEDSRKVNETNRVSAEGAREASERTRVSSEETRNANEQTRNSNETKRQSQESTRQSQESARQANESTRNTNESARKEAESERKTEETSRRTAELSRSSAENTRVKNEQNRTTAENTRSSAEDRRVANETQRTTNETARNNAELSRAQAEGNRASTFETLKGQMQTTIQEGQTAVAATEKATSDAQKVVDNYDEKVAEQDGKLSELGSYESRIYQGEHNAYSSIKFSENPLKEGGILFNRGVSVTIANINDNSIKNTISSGTEFLLPYTAKGSLLCGATSGTVDLEYHYYNGKKNAIDTKKELEGIDSNRVLKSNNKNLIILDNLINNYFISSTGGFSSNSNYSITEYIPIDEMTNYYLSKDNGTYPGSNATYWNIYDKNLNIIFSSNTALISTPKDAKYLRCTLEHSTIHSAMLEKGDTRTEFVKGSPIAGYIKDIEQTLSNVSQTLDDVSSNLYSTSKIDYYGEKEAYTGIKLSEGRLKAGGKITNRGIRIQIYNAATNEITAIPSNSVYILHFDAKGTAIAGSSSGIADVSYEYYVTQKDAIESVNEVSESLISEINTIKEDIGNYTEEKPITLTKAAYGSINNIFIPKGSIITSFGGYNGGLLMCPYEQFTTNEYTTIYQKNLPYTTLTDIKSIRPNADIDNTILYIDQGKGIKKSIELINEKIESIESGSGIKVKPLGSTYKGSLSDGDLIILEKNSVKGEDSFAFCANITNFNKIKIGRGTPYEKLYSSAWIEIDNTNIVAKTYYSSTQSYENTYPHGLSITNNIQVLMYCSYDGKANIKLVSNGKLFEQQIGWNGFNGSIFVESEGSSLRNVVYSWTCKKLKSDIWLFGDSYFGTTSESRWLYYLLNSGYKDVLINGYAGAGCANAYSDVTKLLQHSTPKYIFWCMGMNNKDTDTSANSTWLSTFEQLKEVCALNNIELIMSTIPTVKGGYVEDTNEYSIRIHKFKNAIVRESGLRYVDFDKAVGANETTGEWYGEMLYTDGVHPASDGAKALFMQAIADFPELMSAEDI